MTNLATHSRCLRAAGVLLEAVLFFACLGASGQERGEPGREQWFKRLDAKQLADLEEKVQKVYAKIGPSVVRIFPKPDEPEGWFSGVIVSTSGEVFTCAHYDLPPRTKVTVQLADGRRVKATTLGLFKRPARDTHYCAHDLGMLLLDDKREWPAAALGRLSDLDNGDLCLAIGNPYGHKPGQPPLLRLGRVLPPTAYGQVRASVRVAQGDSGGPLLDLQGRVLGVLSNTPSFKWAGNNYAAADVFREFRDRLREGEEVVAEREHPGRPIHPPKDSWGAFEADPGLVHVVAGAHRSTVELLGDGKPVALGLIVGADGWVVTKWTEVLGCKRIVCRLADGRRPEARILSGSKEHDLALLKVEAIGLPAATWAKADGLRVGHIVASLGPDPRPLHFGVVGGTHVSNPAIHGYIPINGKPTTPEGQSGHAFTEVWDNRPDAGDLRERLKAGDLITHVDDVPTPTAEEYVKVRDKRMAAPDALIGERVKLSVRRGQETFQVFAPIVSSATPASFSWKECPRSLRRNGFPNVFAHDGGIAPEQCGGPVVDRTGRVVGLNIARADEVQTFAIPSDVAEKAVAAMRSKAEQK